MLAKRVQEARELAKHIVAIPGVKGAYGMRSHNSQTPYQVRLRHQNETSQFGDRHINHPTFICKCNETVGVGMDNHICEGNKYQTVCYHCLASLVFSFEKINESISFYDSIFNAMRALSFGGSLAKVISKQGKGIIWAIVRNKVSSQLSKKEAEETLTSMALDQRVDLMRGSREDNRGID